jgi:hypothetical protein
VRPSTRWESGLPVAADLVDAPIDFQAVIVRIAKFDSDLATGSAAAGEIDLDAVPAQMVVRPHDLVEGRDLEGEMVEVEISRLLCHRADERDSVMIGVAAQKDHAPGHHLLRIDVRDLKPEHFGVEPRRAFDVAHVQDDMAQLADAEGQPLRSL